jgi:hypothetical protein
MYNFNIPPRIRSHINCKDESQLSNHRGVSCTERSGERTTLTFLRSVLEPGEHLPRSFLPQTSPRTRKTRVGSKPAKTKMHFVNLCQNKDGDKVCFKINVNLLNLCPKLANKYRSTCLGTLKGG